MPKVWRRESKPHKFCPGCGHPLALRALGEAVDELGWEERVIIGCDIGCSLLAWDFFNLDTLQTHHGRTLPVLAGLKRVRPELVPVAYMGDGGAYAIGAQHLVSAASRDEPVFTLVVNNAVYAMTGGQMAPTTIPDQKTETTPFGRDPEWAGPPLRGAEMAAAVSGPQAYIARGTVADLRQLKRFVLRGLQNRHFTLIEVLSTCPTNWRTQPGETWEWVEKVMPRYFPLGEIKSGDREVPEG
ncbi:MAG: thiamine pyrophosphate-dependent enzyme [Clostridia bacterium]|jgi:2-oxoglutarate ferredoxin oxidoreductase subunit beta|nr:thiamine pyrophosphate-dependent enzyme [Clostridia bacterium]